MGILSGLLSMFGWGTADFLAAKSSRKIGYILTLFWMQVIGFFIALIYFLINFHSFKISIIPQFLVILAIVGILESIAYLAFYKGLKEGKISLVSPIGASWAMVTVILSVIFFKETLKTNQITGIVLVIFGIVLISLNIKELFKIKKLGLVTGVKEGLVAMLGWGIAIFLMVPASKALGWFLPIFIFRLFAILFLTIYILSARKSFKVGWRPSLWALLLPIGILDMGAFFTFSFGVSRAYASIVAPVAAAFPLITIILARLFLKERLTLTQAFGIIGVIAGIILISI